MSDVVVFGQATAPVEVATFVALETQRPVPVVEVDSEDLVEALTDINPNGTFEPSAERFVAALAKMAGASSVPVFLNIASGDVEDQSVVTLSVDEEAGLVEGTNDTVVDPFLNSVFVIESGTNNVLNARIMWSAESADAAGAQTDKMFAGYDRGEDGIDADDVLAVGNVSAYDGLDGSGINYACQSSVGNVDLEAGVVVGADGQEQAAIAVRGEDGSYRILSLDTKPADGVVELPARMTLAFRAHEKATCEQLAA